MNTNGYDYVIASDTDSIYLRLGKTVHAAYQNAIPDNERDVINYLDKVCSNLIEPFIEKSYSDLGKYVNAFQQKMIMKREIIASKGIWRGKKMYILNVYNNEGIQYQYPKLKIMGIEAVRSSTPQVCRDKIKEAISIIMNGNENELIQFVSNFYNEFMMLPFEQVAFPRSLNGVNKYSESGTGWRKGTPIHVRGALVYNRMLKRYKLNNHIAELRDGDKIRFCYLKLPNPTMENVIASIDELPSEFNLEQFIDRDTQFNKSFKQALKSITDVIGWKLEKTASLESFFA